MSGKRKSEPARKKQLLTLEQLIKLEELVREVFTFVTELRKRDSLANAIQYPKIPTDLSESAIVHLRPTLFPGSSEAHLAGGEGDVIVTYPDGTMRRVEVKATEKWEFQRFGERDVSADYIVWISFGPFFRNLGGQVTLYLLESPGDFFKKPQLIQLRKFLGAVPEDRLRKLVGPSVTAMIRNHENS